MRSTAGTSPSSTARSSGPTTTSIRSSTSTAATCPGGCWLEPNGPAWPRPSWPRPSKAGHPNRRAHHPLGPRISDDRPAGGPPPGRPRRHQITQPPPYEQRQSVLRKPLPDPQVPTGLPQELRLLRGRPRPLRSVLHLDNDDHRHSGIGFTPQPTSTTDELSQSEHSATGTRRRLRRPPGALRPQGPHTSGTTDRGVDQPTRGGNHDGTVIPQTFCLTKVDRRRRARSWLPPTRPGSLPPGRPARAHRPTTGPARRSVLPGGLS